MQLFEHESLQELMDASEFIFFTWRNAPGWPVEFVSGNTTRLLGYTPEMFREGTISYSDIIHPQDLPRVMEEVTRYSESTQKRFTHEPYRVVHRDGRSIWVHDATRIVRDTEGNITHYIGYITDITSLKMRERNLEETIRHKTETIREQKRLFKTLVEKSADGIVILKEEHFIICNPAAASLLGYESEEELLSLHPGQISPKNQPDGTPSKEKASRMIELAMRQGQHHFEWLHQKKDGTPIWFDITLTRIVLAGEEVIYASMHPIDMLKTMQEQLQRLNASLQEDVRIQKSLYEELFNNAKDGIVLIKEDTIIDANPAIFQIFDVDNIPQLQSALFEIDFFERELQTAIKDGYHTFDCGVYTPRGRRIWLEVTLTPMHIMGERLIYGHCRDITRRKELEYANRFKTEQLIQQSRLAQMGEMISMIAHQWRQPLAAVSATLIAMQTKIELGKIFSGASREEIDYLLERFGKINHNVQFLSHTIDDFRNFFKSDKQRHRFDLVSSTKRALSIIESSLYNRNIRVLLEECPSKPIDSYENEVIQVILNLLKNAEDALIERKIEDPYIKIMFLETQHYRGIAIEDNGGGIPEEILPQIFDPYFSTKSKNGTGLGLYMSKVIIEEHCHGLMKAENSTSGARFTLMLPLHIKEKDDE